VTLLQTFVCHVEVEKNVNKQHLPAVLLSKEKYFESFQASTDFLIPLSSSFLET
jgi:hypothetical protein